MHSSVLVYSLWTIISYQVVIMYACKKEKTVSHNYGCSVENDMIWFISFSLLFGLFAINPGNLVISIGLCDRIIVNIFLMRTGFGGHYSCPQPSMHRWSTLTRYYLNQCGDRSAVWFVLQISWRLPITDVGQWRHNERDGVSNYRRDDCLLNLLFARRSKKTLNLCVTRLCSGNSPVTNEFPTQRASNAENVTISWHHDASKCQHKLFHPPKMLIAVFQEQAQ